jgi:hypothetical protein
MAMNKKAQKFLSKKPSGSTPKSQMPTRSTKASKQMSGLANKPKPKRGKGDVSAYV